MKHFDTVIVGAGIVGLATAYQLLRLNPSWKILIVEKEKEPALHQSGRNSGVIHTGVYYKPGSLKARNCIQGRGELLAFCEETGVSYRKKHKLIVATKEEERARLQEILLRGMANGVPGLKVLSQESIKEIEPNVAAIEALYVPECHIVAFDGVAKALCESLKQKGAEIFFSERVLQIQKADDRYAIETDKQTISCQIAINCAGLYSDQLARSYFGTIEDQIIPFRGEYYQLTEAKSHLVNGLIYPVPDPKFPFLGVHLTPMMNAKEGYRKTDFNFKEMQDLLRYGGFWKMAFRYWKTGVYEMYRSWSKKIFLKDLQRLVPSIEERDLMPGHRGIRAQVVKKDGTMADDFVIRRDGRAIHVVNAPSPAATASFAIGRSLAEMAMQTSGGLK
jgi:L-2-hydroxyglutarate oxidase LhgO